MRKIVRKKIAVNVPNFMSYLGMLITVNVIMSLVKISFSRTGMRDTFLDDYNLSSTIYPGTLLVSLTSQ